MLDLLKCSENENTEFSAAFQITSFFNRLICLILIEKNKTAKKSIPANVTLVLVMSIGEFLSLK